MQADVQAGAAEGRPFLHDGGLESELPARMAAT